MKIWHASVSERREYSTGFEQRSHWCYETTWSRYYSGDEEVVKAFVKETNPLASVVEIKVIDIDDARLKTLKANVAIVKNLLEEKKKIDAALETMERIIDSGVPLVTVE